MDHLHGLLDGGTSSNSVHWDLKIDIGSNVNIDSGGMKGGTPRYSPSLEGTGAVAGQKITGGVTLQGRALVLGLCIVGRGSMWTGTPVHLRAFTHASAAVDSL